MNYKTVWAGALVTGMLLCGSVLASVAQAQGDDQDDAIVRADRAQHGDLRLGVANNPHKRVCTDAKDGQANCHARVITDSRGSPAASPNLVSGYGPQQFLGAYGLSGLASGNPIVAVVDAYDNPNIANDLATYSKQFGIAALPSCAGAIAASSAPCFKKVNQRGAASPLPSYNSGWALESALDAELAHATCQNCRILLVEANSNSYADLMTAVDQAVAQGAKVISNSYGSSEFGAESQYDSHFNIPGVAFIFSSGDAGYGAQYPAASNLVTAVGGTTLLVNADNSYKSESAWSGSGSGCSLYESKPSWQIDTGCAKRTIADVSADADPNTGAAVYLTARNGRRTTGAWYQVGGTSLSAPLIAGAYALGGVPTSPSANALPYSAPAGSLNDIITGSNGSCGGSYLCTALLGYDGPTGLGTPKGIGAF